MHAFLIVGKNKNRVDQKISELTTNKRVLPYSIEKIEYVRELSKFLKLSQSDQTAVLVKGAENATTEALNAFLKNLEEPGKNISYILTARSEQNILPTILSRCQIIRVGDKSEEDAGVEVAEMGEFLRSEVGEKLKTISKIKTREEGKDFVEKLIYGVHKEMLTTEGFRITSSKQLEVGQKALDHINANGNVSLQLTNLVIKLENIK